MQGTATGPLGALLIIVPLAAIPVFAVVGVPQFAPVIASFSGDDEFSETTDEEISDLGTAASSYSSSPSKSRFALNETPGKRRSASDLYAPVDNFSSIPASNLTTRSANPQLKTARPDHALEKSVRQRSTESALLPAEALDEWEIRPELSETLARQGDMQGLAEVESSRDKPAGATETLELRVDESDDGRISADGFASDLMNPGQDRKESRTPIRGLTEPPRNRREHEIDANGAGRKEGPPQTAEVAGASLSEQSGWQIAARRLKELGIRKYRLESQIEEQTFVFVCSFSSKENLRVVHRFEAVADTPLEAVQDVLEQIDGWRSREGESGPGVVVADDAH